MIVRSHLSCSQWQWPSMNVVIPAGTDYWYDPTFEIPVRGIVHLRHFISSWPSRKAQKTSDNRSSPGCWCGIRCAQTGPWHACWVVAILRSFGSAYVPTTRTRERKKSIASPQISYSSTWGPGVLKAVSQGNFLIEEPTSQRGWLSLKTRTLQPDRLNYYYYV